MDLEPTKLLIIVGAAVALYLLTRSITGQAEQTSPPLFQEPEAFDEQRRSPAVVGSEMPFPFDVSELEAKYGSNYYRPRVRNYYFSRTDLVSGPPDPNSFRDDLFVELEDPDTGHRWTAGFAVTTPTALLSQLEMHKTDFVFCESTIVVRYFDLRAILHAVLDHYAQSHPTEEEPLPGDEASDGEAIEGATDAERQI